MRVAYTLEQCWHRVPGGTAAVTLRVAEAMAGVPGVELVGVAGRHREPPPEAWRPPIPVRHLPLRAPLLYETWLRFGRPLVERATGPVDVAHATGVIPCPTRAPLVVTQHDLGFLRDPTQFTKHGVRVFTASWERIKQRAAIVLCSTRAVMDDCVRAGMGAERLRHVPFGVDPARATADDVRRVRDAYSLPERFLLFVGAIEPRKNLVRLVQAIGRLEEPLPLVVAGAPGWGEVRLDEPPAGIRFIGFVPRRDLAPLYAAAEAFCFPSEREGFGMPVLEAMAQGAPVVTSRGTGTEEAAGGAAVLVEPLDVDDIARGISEALRDRDHLSKAGLERAAGATWARTARLTADAYGEVAA